MKFKKVIASLLLITMVLGAGVACSKKEDTEETTTEEPTETTAERLAYGEIAADDFAAAIEQAGGTVTRDGENVVGEFSSDVVVSLVRFTDDNDCSEYFSNMFDEFQAHKDNGEVEGSYSMSRSTRAGDMVLSCTVAGRYVYGLTSFAGRTCVEIYTNTEDKSAQAIIDSIIAELGETGPAEAFNFTFG